MRRGVRVLAESVICEYLAPLVVDQAAAILWVRGLLRETSPGLVEAIDDGKWFGGLLTYTTTGGAFVYALGPRAGGTTTFHMHPYYGSKALQERHGLALKKFLTGKSCIRFKRYEDLPEDALRDIILNGPKVLAAMQETFANRKTQTA
jgi:hypothetical protein